MSAHHSEAMIVQLGNLGRSVAVFLASLPGMWLVGQFAIFAFGFGVWVVPWLLGAALGGWLMPQGSPWASSEFDGPIIAFAFFAAIQNVIMYRWSQAKRRR